jgi:DnaK suppressor protein
VTGTFSSVVVGGTRYPLPMPDQDLSAAVRASLEDERTTLQEQLGEIRGESPEAAPSFDENFADSGQVAAEQGEVRIMATTLQEQLDDVEHALQRLDEGSYGTCEVCGEAIADARLEAMPATRFCIEHA